MKVLRSLLLLAFLAVTAHAQTQKPTATPSPSGDEGVIKVFRAKLPGGVYEVSVRSIIAVTSHEYMVDAVARVTEVNIDTAGSLLARFYYLEPSLPNSPIGLANTAADQAQRMLKEAADKTGADVWKKVIKNYPTTTHAHTVEYRVESLEQLNQIYTAAEAAFRLQKDTKISLGGSSE